MPAGYRRMQTRHLRYFIAVAEECNFHRAAERLHVSQPALWRQIRDLEADLGVALLDRQPRGIALTPAGAAFRDDCRDILEMMEGARLHARRVAQGQSGTIHVAFNEIAGRRAELPRFLRAFREAHPGIDIRLHAIMSQQQIEALGRGELDAGFLFRQPGQRPDLSSHRIARDHVVLAVPRGHRLAQRTAPALADLAGEPLILPNPRYNGAIHDRLVAAFDAAGLAPRVTQFADNENTLVNLVSAGVGLAFLHASYHPSDAQGVVLRPLSDLTLPMDLELVWRAPLRQPALERFVRLVERLAGDLAQVEQMMETGMG